MKKKHITAIAILAFVILLGIAGRIDYTEEVIYHMPQKAYNEIKDTLGHDASDYDIARYYTSNYEKAE